MPHTSGACETTRKQKDLPPECPRTECPPQECHPSSEYPRTECVLNFLSCVEALDMLICSGHWKDTSQ